GIGALIAALVTALEFAVPGGDASSVLLPVVWALVGLAAFGFNALRLSASADTRERQMTSIAERALALTSDPPGGRSEAVARAASESESQRGAAGATCPHRPGGPPTHHAATHASHHARRSRRPGQTLPRLDRYNREISAAAAFAVLLLIVAIAA